MNPGYQVICVASKLGNLIVKASLCLTFCEHLAWIVYLRNPSHISVSRVKLNLASSTFQKMETKFSLVKTGMLTSDIGEHENVIY